MIKSIQNLWGNLKVLSEKYLAHPSMDSSSQSKTRKMKKEVKLLLDVKKSKQDRKKLLLANYQLKIYLISHGGGSLVEPMLSLEFSGAGKKTSCSYMKVK